MTEQALMKDFNFNEGDLAANRSGQLTEKQRAHLSGAFRTRRKKNWLQAGCSAAAGLAGAAVSLTAAKIINDYSFLPIMILTAFNLVWVGCCGILAVTGLAGAFAPLQLTLNSAQGAVKFTQVKEAYYKCSTNNVAQFSYRHYRAANQMLVDTQIFGVTANQVKLMSEGDVYRVYYNDGMDKQVLSLERISPSPAPGEG